MKTTILTLAATLMLFATACNQNDDIPLPVQKQNVNQVYEDQLYEDIDEDVSAERIKAPAKKAGTMTSATSATKNPKLVSHSETGSSIERAPHPIKQAGQLIPYTPKDPNAVGNTGSSTERTATKSVSGLTGNIVPGSCADFHQRKTLRVMFNQKGFMHKDAKTGDYLIHTSTDDRLFACDLPAQFKSEGAKVIFSAQIKQQYPYEKWSGMPVDLLDIKTDYGKTKSISSNSNL